MISLKELFLSAYPEYPRAVPDIRVRGVECDSRQVRPGFLFIAVRGIKEDGRRFIQEAERQGASALVVDTSTQAGDLPVITVPDCRDAVSRLASAFYGHPSRSMRMVGVTGTNGKTTVSYLLEHLLRKENQNPGVIGTINYRYSGKELPAVETTPGPLKLQPILADMKKAGCRHAVMEVSSHALDQGRVRGIDFDLAVFTNLTQDHLDYHGTLDAYFECKATLFLSLRKEAHAVLNADSEWTARLVERSSAEKIFYGIAAEADFRAGSIASRLGETEFDVTHRDRFRRVRLPMMGQHNVYNALAALASMNVLGFDWEKASENLSDFPGVPGRLEIVQKGQAFTVLIDFAHTPDGLENVLRSLQEYRKQKLILVFGCGGDRDKTKRPKMAAIAARYTDRVLVTSDNPRSESAKAIADEICAGFPADFRDFSVVPDRRKAIRQALLAARHGDIVLLAGKGHERTQIIGKEAYPFSDREEAEKVLDGR